MSDALLAEHVALLVCPTCKAPLQLARSKLSCTAANHHYDIVDGIPILLPQRLPADLLVTEQKWSDRYASLHAHHLSLAEAEYDNLYASDTLQHLQRTWGHIAGQKYLEIGCGPAFLASHLARAGADVVGIDISIGAARLARTRFERDGLVGLFVCGDILHMPFAQAVFDCSYGGGVLEHFANTAVAIRELRRVIRPNGHAFNTVPTLSLSSVTYRQLWGNIPDLPVVKELAEFVHLRLLRARHMTFGYELSFTTGRLQTLFRKEGFPNVRVDLFNCYMPLTYIRPTCLKPVLRRLARWRPFWPMVYVDAS